MSAGTGVGHNWLGDLLTYSCRRKSLRIRLLFSVLGLIGFLGLGIVPAHAQPVLGTGLIRIDANWATVKTLPTGVTVLTLNKESSGQWMGEIGGSLEPVVRNIDDRNLVKVWGMVGHISDVGAESTLTWNSTQNYQLVKLSAPSLTPRGHLRFVIEPGTDLPVRIEQVSVNITRAASPQNRSFPLTQSFPLTAGASAQTTNTMAFNASVMFSNGGANCYTVTLVQPSPTATLPANLACGSVTFASGSLTMTLPLPTGKGNVFFNTTMIVSGSPFSFSGIIAQWSQSGS